MIERRLLSKLLDPKEIATVWEYGLRPEVFEDPPSRFAYEFIVDYWLTSQMQTAPTKLVIETEVPGLTLHDHVEEEGWWLAKALMERFTRNSLQETVVHVAKMSDPAEAMSYMQTKSYEAIEAVAPRYLRSDMSDFESRRQRYLRREGGSESGLTLGVPEIDEWTGGVRPGELAVVGAFSKVGKTMMLLNAAAHAWRQGRSPIVFTLEMPVDEIEDRLDALLSGVSYDRLSRHRLTDKERAKLYDTQVEMAESGRPLRIESPDEGDRTVSSLCARARYAQCDYVLVDQLSFVEESVLVRSEKHRLGSILKSLKNEIGNASRGKLGCFLAHQLNRESLERLEGPMISDFADAAEVERTADLLLALSRNQQERVNRVMKFSILGGRRCDSGQWMLHWDLVDRSHISVLERITK